MRIRAGLKYLVLTAACLRLAYSKDQCPGTKLGWASVHHLDYNFVRALTDQRSPLLQLTLWDAFFTLVHLLMKMKLHEFHKMAEHCARLVPLEIGSST